MAFEATGKSAVLIYVASPADKKGTAVTNCHFEETPANYYDVEIENCNFVTVSNCVSTSTACNATVHVDDSLSVNIVDCRGVVATDTSGTTTGLMLDNWDDFS